MNRRNKSLRLNKFRNRIRTAETLEPRIVLDSTVVINEIMYNPLEADGVEWIELYNQLNADMDISEWVLDGAVRYEFPNESIVPGRGHLIIAADPESLQDDPAFASAHGPWEGRLSNAGEEILLYNNDNRLMNSVDFGDSGAWPTAPDGGGVSLAKGDQLSGSHLAESWTFSQGLGGTPGLDNFISPGTFRFTEITTEETPIKATVPTDNSMGLDWIQPGFDDSSWLVGTPGVGHESSSRPTYDPHLGLDLDDPPNDQDAHPFEDVNASVYIRQTFNMDASMEFDSIDLQMKYDDGFIAYLNGTEIVRENAPDAATWNSSASGSHSDRNAVLYESFSLQEFTHLFQDGENLLAIHGMNSSVTGNDSLFSPLIVVGQVVHPVPQISLQLSEVGPAADANFFVEIVNTGSEAVDLTDITIVNRGEQESTYAFGGGVLNPGEMRSVNAADLGFTSADNDFVGIYTTDKSQLMDAIRVSDRLRGRSEENDGRWLFPSAATPGDANQFAFNDSIVINEIMYHPHPELSIPDTPPQYDTTPLVRFDSNWRYNATGARLAAGWEDQTYAVDGQNWLEGQGLLGAETSALPRPINTEFIRPSQNDPRFVTYYFQTDFEVTAEDLANADVLQLNHIIDDAAVIFLNGEEIHRFNLPADSDPDTTSDVSVRNAELTSDITVPKELLQVGNNVISAEVHLRTLSDSDIVFGAELVRGKQVSEFIPGREFREKNEEEWIELYNKGQDTVDLTGWSIRDGVRFDFPDGTQLGAGEYLIIANDAEHLGQKFTDIRIAGSYDGRLSDHDDRILLRDANNNPADEVHYFEGGQWPEYADGGGVSLELTNPNADNSKGTVWAASDDSSEVEWVTHTFQDTSLLDIYGRPLFDEFLFGLLGPGEFLIDDVEVLKDPDGQAIKLMQNGTFENDEVGSEPDAWRIIGNHSGVVITDPTDAGNKVLHITAHGAMAHVHDHVETTFANREDIDDGTDYQISFRAKWVSGASQLNSRLWFNRLSNTVRLDVPERPGTPGAQNSTFQANVGPVYSDFHHSPVLPAENQAVTIQVKAEDPDNVSSVKLVWREDRQPWNTVDMALNAAGNYQAEIPGHEGGDIIQFYVEGQDSQGAVSMYPAEGPDSRALYQVDDGRSPSTPIDSYRMIMTDPDNDDLFSNVNRMSNDFKGITLIHNDTVYYDVEARMIGSRFIRPNSGYKIKLNPDQPFWGVHDSIRFDLDGLREIVIKQMINRTGGSKASQYDDIGFLLANNRGHSHEVLVQLARYENLYLNEQFENGSDGTKFEVDDVTVPSGGGREGLKTGTEVNTGQDIGGTGNALANQRDNPEFYRAHILIKSNRAKDDYASIARLAQAIHLNGDELFEATNEVMDVDLWMRHYAHQSFLGAWDTYGFGRPKNLRIFIRPSDEKAVPLMWDCDRCPMDRAIKQRVGVSRLDEIRDIPHNLRLYWGHMNDFLNTSFTNEYVAEWAGHFGALAGGRSHGADGDFNEIVSKMRSRIPEAIRDMERDIPRVDFEITTNDGNDLETDQSSILLEGKGWVDIRHMRVAGVDSPLSDVFWPDEDEWQVTLPLTPGANAITLEAIDYRGNLISTDTINVTSTAVTSPVNSLRVTEVHFNPSDPTTAEAELGFDNNNDFEFIEVTNIGSQTISLNGVSLDRVEIDGNEEGVDFDFSLGAITELEPGARVVVVEDAAAFAARYGTEIPVAGQWAGGLGNNSETVTLSANGLAFNQFAYSDTWYEAADGNGSSLEIFDASADLAQWNTAEGWRASAAIDGTPGAAPVVPGDANGDGRFSSEDLVAVFQAGEYEDGVDGNSTFAEGDWNGDGDFNSRDFVFAFIFGAFEPDDPANAVKSGLATMNSANLESVGAAKNQRLDKIQAVDQIFDELEDSDHHEEEFQLEEMQA